jgi:tetratricopeptide (TPR) repeat protein
MGRHAVSVLCLGLGLGLLSLYPACGKQPLSSYNPFVGPDRSSELMPVPLSASRSFDGTPRTVKMRVYADHEHRVQSRRWTAKFQEQVDLANEILIPEFGIQLEVVEFKEWTRQAPSDRLNEVLDELEARDSGADVHWVIGLVSALSSVTTSMHDLGVARPLGRHMVMRGYSDIAERKALGNDYSEELFMVRKRHKQATLLLHEWAHTMGAIHLAGDDTKLMNTYYSKDITGFTLQNANLIRAVLEVRLLESDQSSDMTEVVALRRYLADTPRWQGWLASDYDSLREMLDHLAAVEQQQPEKHVDVSKSGIPAEAQAIFQRVRALARGGKVDAALAELDDLLKAYPAHTEFRMAACELWLNKDGPEEAAIAQCNRVAELDPGNPAGDLLLARAHAARGRLLAAHKILSALAQRVATMTELPAEAQKELWTAVLGTYQAMRAVTWTEAALAWAPGSVDVKEFRAWAVATRRRYGLPPTARRHKITPAGEPEYLAQVRTVLDLTYAKKYNDARNLALKALRTYPNAPGLLGALCDLELRMRQFGAARARCVKAVSGHGEASWPRYLLGIIELRSKRNRAGIDHLKKAIDLDPDLRQAYHALYKAYKRTKDAQGQDQVRQAYKERFGLAIPAN